MNEATFWLALMIWKEARGSSFAAKQAVGWVALNRAKRGAGWPRTVIGVVTQAYQFSSLTAPGDPNLIEWPRDPTEQAWMDAKSAALAILSGKSPDPTSGATFYFTPPLVEPPHAWGNVTKTAEIDGVHFYR